MKSEEIKMDAETRKEIADELRMSEDEALQASEPAKYRKLHPKNDYFAKRVEKGRFAPGVSGNPAGRPKRSESEKELMSRIRKMGDLAVDSAEQMLKSNKVAGPAKAQIITLILAYILGKPESSLKVTTDQVSAEETKARIDDLISRIKVG